MKKALKKSLALVSSAAICASMITIPAVTAGAAENGYAGGKLTVNADKAYDKVNIIVASYKENKTLDSAKLTETSLQAGENVIDVDAPEGSKIMVWDGMTPICDAVTADSAEVPTEAPTEAPTETPTEDPGIKVLESWKFDFGTDVAEGYTAVGPDVNYAENGTYGFIGTNENDYNLGNRLDGVTTQKGQVIKLQQDNNGIGSVGEDDFGNAGDKYYPVRFALKAADEQYFRVTATVTTLDDSKPAIASLYTERKHPIFSKKEIPAGESITRTFTIRTTPIYYEKSDPKGVIKDEMVNVWVIGENTAFADIQIDRIETAPVLWVLGDSTVTDGNTTLPFSRLQTYTGVGTGLQKYLPENIALVNEGEGGLNALDNAHFNMVKERIKPGDYMYVEYGHNHKDGDVTAEYLGCLDKYYQACKAADATLIIVGPIDRVNNYDSTNNVWSSSLSRFSNVGKGYVDSMMYGGEAAANRFKEIYIGIPENGDKTAAFEYRDSVVKEANGVRAVEKIAFVDLNEPSLRFFESITAKGSIGGTEVTNSEKLIHYYFQTSKDGATDHTHTNDAGSEALAYRFYTTADTEAYPAIKPLMANFEEGKEHEVPSPVDQAAMDAGDKAGKGNVGWPSYVVPSDNEYPVVIRTIDFDEEGNAVSANVKVQQAKINMAAYGIIEITIYDADGNEIGKNYAASQVDNSTGYGDQKIEAFKNDVKLPADGTYTAVVWQAKDNGGDIGLTVDPANVQYSAVYKPTPITNYILPGAKSDIETFEYDLAETLDGVTDGKWKLGGSAGKSLPLGNDNGTPYAGFISDGAKNGSAGQGSFYVMRPLEDIPENGTGAAGRYMISADIKYVSGGGLTFAFAKNTTPTKSPFVTDELPCFTIGANGAVTVPGAAEAVGQVSATSYTPVQYILDMNAGTAEISVGGGTPVIAEVPNYATFGAPAIDTLKHFILEGQKVAFNVNVANLTVAKLKDSKNTTTLAASVADGQAAMGTVGEAVTVAQGTEASITATAAEGYRFERWLNGDAVFSEDETVTISRLYKDLALTAEFTKLTSPAKVTVNYVNENNEPVREAVEITETDGRLIYTGDPFELDGVEHTAAVKINNESGLYDVYVYDSTKSDALKIDALEPENAINIVYTKLDGSYYDYEDFTDTAVGKWGFTEGKSGNVKTADGILYLFTNVGTKDTNPDVKTMDEAIAAEKKLTVSFDWKNGVEAGKGRNSLFNLYDASGNYIFSLNASGKNGVDYSVGAAAGSGTKVGNANDWCRVQLSIDFEAGKLSGSITNLATGAVTQIDETAITATNLAKMQADYGYSLAPQYLDNISFRKDS